MQSRPRVALLVETSNSYARELLFGIRRFLRERGSWSLYLSEQGRGDEVPAWLAGWTGEGVIARVENAQIAEAVSRAQVPVVDVSFALEPSPFPRVVTDSEAVTRLAAEHLLERGFRHFGYCGDPQYHWSNVRSQNFQAHIQRTGHDCEIFADTSSRDHSGDWEHAIESLARWVGRLPKPAGIMACWDIRGQQVLEACRRQGARVPDDVAVIGVHNDELLCDLCDPPLSSVIPNARRAGYEAARLLDRMMRGEQISAHNILIEPLGVATRQSSDVVAVDDLQISAAVRFIRDHAVEGIRVDDVLRAVPMARTLLERRFRQCLKCSPHEHILKVRLDRVKAMLANTPLPLAIIAERTGFEHPEYLSVAFKRVVGLTPSQYRARHAT